MENKGYIHLYTGDGKGKTTAAIGLAIRAAGANKKVFIAQFVKGMHYSELDALKRFPEIQIKQYGLDCFILNKPKQEDFEAARKGIEDVKIVVSDNLCDVLILDEVCIALHYHLFEVAELLEILKNKPLAMEIVMTGRRASPTLINASDLVSEMREVKHYFNEGVVARKGIEY